jgi:hypothetical protein
VGIEHSTTTAGLARAIYAASASLAHPSPVLAWDALPETVQRQFETIALRSEVQSRIWHQRMLADTMGRLDARIRSRRAQALRLSREGDKYGAVLVGAKWSEAVACREEIAKIAILTESGQVPDAGV